MRCQSGLCGCSEDQSNLCNRSEIDILNSMGNVVQRAAKQQCCRSSLGMRKPLQSLSGAPQACEKNAPLCVRNQRMVRRTIGIHTDSPCHAPVHFLPRVASWCAYLDARSSSQHYLFSAHCMHSAAARTHQDAHILQITKLPINYAHIRVQ